ncbi:DUF4893 domain-containing protein [Devosia elaeis]|uniref:DUF4893 domain-containing protein n=1 Tax=Devosia elaeis TaxID=1770058 RepID=A0A178I5Y9_9HYPH|nr:DUF4893 domain-containing protein [Devosia elaeis]OAM80045.1 hypothetical protein A3840_02245 [Devosia elaeis]
MSVRSRPFAALALAGLLALQPLSALACTMPKTAGLNPADQERMRDFWGARSQGLAEALVAESAGDAPLQAIPDGDYRCRTIKLGGLLPLTVYSAFDCTISGNGTRIDKQTGSQRFSGSLMPAGTALFYRGALNYDDEAPLAYDADPERNQVGCLYGVPDNGSGPRYRLELPRPHFESNHDVIELVPKR